MDSLVVAIRTALTDVTLNAIVLYLDITTTYSPESANYPCIVLGISAGGSQLDISGVTRASLRIDVYSKTNKLHLYTIYNLVKGLLHNQERNVTTATRFIHVIYESDVQGDQYDSVNDVWQLTAFYEIVYSTSSVVITSGASGSIYADASDVTAVAGKKIADFRGPISLDVGFEKEANTDSHRFGKTVHYRAGIAVIRVRGVAYKPAIYNMVWGVTYNASGTLADDSTAATTYTITQTTKPTLMQFLFQGIRTDDGKKLEIEADRAYLERIDVPLRRSDVSVYDCEWVCLGDSSGNVVKVSVQN